MGAEYDAAARWRAMELYCADRLTFAQVAEATGVADSTLRRWADAYQWRERREELARAEVDIRIDTIRSRAAILRHLIEAQDGKAASQIAFAVSSLGNLALQREKALLAGEIANPAKPEKPVKVSSRAEAIAVLKQAVEDKLGLLLSDKKYVTSDSVTDIAKCLWCRSWRPRCPRKRPTRRNMAACQRISPKGSTRRWGWSNERLGGVVAVSAAVGT